LNAVRGPELQDPADRLGVNPEDPCPAEVELLGDSLERGEQEVQVDDRALCGGQSLDQGAQSRMSPDHLDPVPVRDGQKVQAASPVRMGRDAGRATLAVHKDLLALGDGAVAVSNRIEHGPRTEQNAQPTNDIPWRSS